MEIKKVRVGLAPPWSSYCSMLKELFKGDPDVTVVEDITTTIDNTEGANKEVKLLVRGGKKADALSRVLPDHKDFGNVCLKITVVPENDDEKVSRVELFKRAFDGNSNVSSIVDVELPFGGTLHYVVFKGEVVQYYDDNLSDAYGNTNTLYEDVAREIFGDDTAKDGIYFCTEQLY